VTSSIQRGVAERALRIRLLTIHSRATAASGPSELRASAAPSRRGSGLALTLRRFSWTSRRILRDHKRPPARPLAYGADFPVPCLETHCDHF
jgi:hypothetical protein